MAVIGPDGESYVALNGKVVKFTESDGTLTNDGIQHTVGNILKIKSKTDYKDQTCLLIAGENYDSHLLELREYYDQLFESKKINNTALYSIYEFKKNKLVDKLRRGFVDSEFKEKFEKDLRNLDSILKSIKVY